MRRFVRGLLYLTITLITLAAISIVPGRIDASLQKPSYAAGDRWVYVLDGSLSSIPGFNGSFRFGIVGLVNVDVIGPADVASGNASVPAVRVDTRASGFLNGTFSVPGGFGTAQVSGSFTTYTSEYWEDQAYVPIASNGTTSYRAEVTYVLFKTQLAADLRLNATASISPIPPFDLDVGQSATANLTTHVDANSTFTIFGQTTTSENSTDVSTAWRREVLSRENVTVEAGTFPAYKLNQTLGSFPVLPAGVSGGNETAYFSNDVGFYVKRVAYENGTPVAEMRLKSYSYGVGPARGWSAVDLLLYVAIPVIAAGLLVLLLWRRRKARIQGRTSEAAPPTDGRTRLGGNP